MAVHLFRHSNVPLVVVLVVADPMTVIVSEIRTLSEFQLTQISNIILSNRLQ